MTDVEERLRDALARSADDAPAPGQLLHLVRTQSRHRRRRRAGVAGGLLLATATVAAVALTGYTGGSTDRDGPDVADGSVQLVAGQLSDVEFPFTPPRTTPAGLGEPVVMLSGGEPMLEYTGGHGMSVTLSSRKPSDPGAVVLPVRPGSSVVIRAGNGLTIQVLRKYVARFEEKPLVQQAPFTFQLVPAGFTVDNVLPSAVTFAPPGVAAGPGFSDKVAVLLEEGSADGTQVTAEGVTLHRSLGDGRTLTVQVPASVALTGADLARFAAGIKPTGAAVVARG
jgi:hypothetical protein